MDADGSPARAGSSCRPTVEFRAEAGGKGAKTWRRRGNSFGKRTGFAFAILPQRFLCELVQPAGPNVRFDLPVPLALVPLDDPARQVPEILFWQLLDCSFDFF